ncbi:uncharacterized protein LOC125943936 [Dermacentor silvarum]|uniref:uncharacterized protein LOC125943936 n=1 Tax=Dermacentor silvarum TaxID=543639 RepID=UPI002100AA13|nr:uncharacterized protein LOC125943936 [Dermacentor silvarum]
MYTQAAIRNLTMLVVGAFILSPTFRVWTLQTKTSVFTPCAFPCVLVDHNVRPMIVWQREVDGTLCKVAGTFSLEPQISSCWEGICQQPNSLVPLKRGRRGVASRNAARNARKKGFGGFRKKKHKKGKKHLRL